MIPAVEALVHDLVEWVAREPRRYEDVMERWRTSCPRLPVWEDAVDRGLVERRIGDDDALYVVATSAGRALIGRDAVTPRA
ncbi:MAG TPA: hypothetical protein PK264_18770 [Hyphomicrobiaceae bacterium]|nr:hypothetical protein [Hyphomicrobiaceae bacterium]